MHEEAIEQTTEEIKKPTQKKIEQAALTDDEKAIVEFVDEKKKLMKNTDYRKRFDNLVGEIDLNLVNTLVSYGQKLYEKTGWGSMVFYNKMSNGAYDINVYPQKLTDRDQNRSGVPVSQEPIAFSKILIATSVLAGKLPDATVVADDKVYGRTMYELWKRTWINRGGNGLNTLMLVYQDVFTYGWAVWRVYPKTVEVMRSGVPKIMFSDIYREKLDVKRTWLGVGFNIADYFSQGEVYYEKDIPKADFFRMHPKAEAYRTKLNYCTDASDIGDDSQKKKTHVTIEYYENVLANKFVIKSGKFVIYNGELPNDENYGSVVVVRCFSRNANDPYGVGMYELMRGNTALYTYINSLNAQQVEAEIFPLIFGSVVQNGTGVYRRSPNVVNPKTPGTDIEVVKTSGNVQQGTIFAEQQKKNIEENTGINNIVAGQDAESTLGSTVILKEAAYNRLTIPRNSVVDGLGTDAIIAKSWIIQTYPADKVFRIASNKDLAIFNRINPDYYIESAAVVDDQYQPTGGYIATASPNLRMDFDFSPDGEVLDNVDTRTISARALFEQLEQHGHSGGYCEFKIDPSSMLLPSIEIQKQTFMALFPIITNQITIIFSLRNTDPDAAAAQLMTLEQMLEIQKQNIYDFIPKKDYDAILSKQPSTIQMQMQQMEMERAATEAAMLAEAGGGAGGKPPAKKQMTSDGTKPLSPQNPREVPRPQSLMTSAFDASVGRAGKTTGFFPE